ncbi:TIGR03086 family metal-binding protein [Prauserella muralis]|uniref:TIGR03086 family protein n=1 Tax=Prauserella muralis TaxID=588067 RepID=A0A2V4B7J4_9PSEU|nr:TIGR03086 family metal-binding protein [Prauserella muralis]PXY31091.1 TIGR03086 family protein [Prauserella muralis]TWE14624.1 uncharacterized protein (TIGR03086 family) [Prauserella muralis]
MAEGLALLERAVGYALGGLRHVSSAALPRPTPCHEWVLRDLLWHMTDSLATLCEAADLGHIGLKPSGDEPADLVGGLCERACALIHGWAAVEREAAVWVADRPLPADIVAAAGAVEITVHGWDVARACGLDRPVPGDLAEPLLELSPLFVTDADRPGRFAEPVAVSPRCEPGDRLLAFLGRDPG